MSLLIVLIIMIFINIQHVLYMIHVFYVDVILSVFSCTKDKGTLLLQSISKTYFPVENENLSDVDVDVVTIVFSCTKARATL